MKNQGTHSKVDVLTSIKQQLKLRRIRRRQPDSIANILSDLVARRGFARIRGQQHLEDAWSGAIGEPGAKYTRVGPLRRGVLEVLVANSVLLQELVGFQKQDLLSKLQDTLGQREIRDIRFRLDDGA
jgi:predicted nucleic acid-binding Zn ribbon protein